MGNGGARSAVQMDVEVPEGLRELRGERVRVVAPLERWRILALQRENIVSEWFPSPASPLPTFRHLSSTIDSGVK